MSWNPDQYHKFQSERAAPFHDLLALVDKRPGLKAVDLGCGTGELTRLLADALPGASVTGLDSSPQMLEKAEAYRSPTLAFERGDLAALSGAWDLVFSNAALQWSPDHERLVPFLFEHLLPGGQICVQVPSNDDHISHVLIRETADEEPFRSILGGFQRISPVLTIEQYAQLLFDQGAEEITVFEKIYPHVLAGADAVVEWVSGTALVPYFERLGSARSAFMERLTGKMRGALPRSPLLYPFRRILFSAKKPAQGPAVK